MATEQRGSAVSCLALASAPHPARVAAASIPEEGRDLCSQQIQLSHQSHWAHADSTGTLRQDTLSTSTQATAPPDFIETERKVKGGDRGICLNGKHKRTPWEKKTNKKETIHQIEFKALVMRMLTELGERIDERSEIFNKRLENIV